MNKNIIIGPFPWYGTFREQLVWANVNPRLLEEYINE